MKPEELSDVIGMLDDEIIADAQKIRENNGQKKWLRWAAAVACLFFVVACVIFNFSPTVAYSVAEAKYPKMEQYPSAKAFIGNTFGLEQSDTYDKWRSDRTAQLTQHPDLSDKRDSFFTVSTQQFMSDLNDENRAYSPLNTYIALSMLAELTDGNSRRQILDLLGVDSIEALRKEAAGLWNSAYRDDGVLSSVLANSVWLDRNIKYDQRTLETLAENYYASSYAGKMGSSSFDKALQNWTDKQTHSLLKKQTENIKLADNTVMSLISTIYFHAKWAYEFDKSNTEEGSFLAPKGYVTCDFMKQSSSISYSWGEKFSAISLPFSLSSANMKFILPDDGVTVNDLINDSEAMGMILNAYSSENAKNMIVHLKMPKFDVSSDIELADGLKKMGVTDIFSDMTADFSPMTESPDSIYLSQAKHAARVIIDEEGCKATAFTKMDMETSAEPPGDEIEFVLDRPFLFVIFSECDDPLFVGAVNDPTAFYL